MRPTQHKMQQPVVAVENKSKSWPQSANNKQCEKIATKHTNASFTSVLNDPEACRFLHPAVDGTVTFSIRVSSHIFSSHDLQMQNQNEKLHQLCFIVYIIHEFHDFMDTRIGIILTKPCTLRFCFIARFAKMGFYPWANFLFPF